MNTRVVNIYKEPYDVYIGRAGQGKDGYFGNDHPVGWMCPKCRVVHQQGEAVDAYEVDFNERIKNDPEFKRRVHELNGQRLGCFCKPRRCHGDVIKEWLDAQTD